MTMPSIDGRSESSVKGERIHMERIENIKIGTRHRKDLGDLRQLEESIKEVGLLQPIAIDENKMLIGGLRRLKACENLGWKEIPVHTVSLKNTTKGELDENIARKDFTISEMVAIKRELELEVKEVAVRPVGRPSKKSADSAEFPKSRETRDIIAEYVGTSHDTLRKAEAIVEAAEKEPDKFGELVKAVDSKRTSINEAYEIVRKARKPDAVEMETRPDEARKTRRGLLDNGREAERKPSTKKATLVGDSFRNMKAHINLVKAHGSACCPICSGKDLAWCCHKLGVAEALKMAEEAYGKQAKG